MAHDFVVLHEGNEISETRCSSEAGAWNKFYRLFPNFTGYSVRALNSLSYTIRKRKTK